MIQSQYLEHARIHMDEDQAVLLFLLGNTEYGLVVDVEFLDLLAVADGRVRVVEITDEQVERRNGYE